MIPGVDAMVGQKDIDEIVDRIVRGYDPLVVILFGSQATGTAGNESDVDLFVLKDDLRRPVERNREVRRLLFGIMSPVDIFVRTPEEFERLRNIVGSLPYEAAHEGRVIYERGQGEGQPRAKVDGARQG
jgi:predicted nucleotidyltransferase